MHGEQQHIFRTARQHKPASAQQDDPTPDSRKIVIDLERLKLAALRQRRFQPLLQRRAVQRPIADLAERKA